MVFRTRKDRKVYRREGSDVSAEVARRLGDYSGDAAYERDKSNLAFLMNAIRNRYGPANLAAFREKFEDDDLFHDNVIATMASMSHADIEAYAPEVVYKVSK